MQEQLLIAILVSLILLIAAVVFLISKQKKKDSDLLLHQKIDSLKDGFTQNLLQYQSNLDNSSKSLNQEISKLYERIGGLDRESQQILSLTKSFHDILKPTKSRGELGESILENLLADVLPRDTILSQYGFKDGRKVDFAIKLPNSIVPIDAKFPMEAFLNFTQAKEAEKELKRKACIDSIKKRIAETAGYIYPDEGTSDFSLMYVPSEAVYYFIITETQLLETAKNKKVFVVGPNTIYAYLKTISIGFKAMKIEETAQEIYNNLKRLEKDIATFTRDYNILGGHLRSASSKYDEGLKRISKVSLKLENMSGGEIENQSESNAESQKNAY
mgnify:CR=1 FL=1